MSDETDAEDTVVIPALREQVIAAAQAATYLADDEPELAYSLTEPERLWLDWFYSLSTEDQGIVERCGESDLSVDEDNFEQMKRLLLFKEAKSRLR